MNLEQLRARLAEISAKVDGFDLDNLTDEQIGELDGLHAEHEDIAKKISAQEKVESMKARSSQSTRKVAPTTASQQTRVEVGASKQDKFGGFNSAGEFFMGVRQAGLGNMPEQFKSVHYEKNGEDGGFLVPEEVRTEIQKKLASDESMLSRVNNIQIGGNALSLPIDESQPWNSGVQSYWTAEGAPLKESQNKLSTAHWRMHKLGALVKATDELIEDAPALESYITNAAPVSIMQKINEAIVNGDGAGKPTGLLRSGFTIAVDKEDSQAADTILPMNVIKMYSRMFPQSRANAVWFINAGAEEQLMGMKNGMGEYIYLSPGGQLNQTPYATLLGRPVIPMMSALPGLGDRGDILFADLNYYYAITKAGQSIKSASSIHMHFDREITAFRFTMRIDGSCPFRTPVTTQFGAYAMSAIITLSDRA